MKQPRQSRKLSVAAGIILIFLILIGDFASAFVGIGSPKPNPGESVFVESGNATITILAGATLGSFVVTFPTPFPVTPSTQVSFTSGASAVSVYAETVLLADANTTNYFMNSTLLPFFAGHTLQTKLPFNVQLINSGVQLHIDVASRTAGGLGRQVWAQGFDSLIGAWEDLGSTVHTPGFATINVGYQTSSFVTLNQTLINDVTGDLNIRIVGQDSAGITTLRVDKLSLFFASTVAPALTTNFAVTSTGLTIFIIGAPGSYGVTWNAYVCLNGKTWLPGC
jgi:hypothetical protein